MVPANEYSRNRRNLLPGEVLPKRVHCPILPGHIQALQITLIPHSLNTHHRYDITLIISSAKHKIQILTPSRIELVYAKKKPISHGAQAEWDVSTELRHRASNPHSDRTQTDNARRNRSYLKVAATEEEVDLDVALALDVLQGLVDVVEVPMHTTFDGYLHRGFPMSPGFYRRVGA